MESNATSQAGPSASVKTVRIEGNIVETVYRGKVTAAMAEQVRRDIEPLLSSISGMEWLINTAEATGFAAAPRESTSGIIELFQMRKGHRIAAVMPSTMIRMLATALVFATGIPLRIFETRDAALSYLRS